MDLQNSTQNKRPAQVKSADISKDETNLNDIERIPSDSHTTCLSKSSTDLDHGDRGTVDGQTYLKTGETQERDSHAVHDGDKFRPVGLATNGNDMIFHTR